MTSDEHTLPAANADGRADVADLWPSRTLTTEAEVIEHLKGVTLPETFALDRGGCLRAVVESEGHAIDSGVDLEVVAQALDPESTEKPLSDAAIAELARTYYESEAKLEDARVGIEAVRDATAGSFPDRFTNTRVSIVEMMKGDLSPPEHVKGSNGVILEGVRHLWPMERKGGKSLATQVMAVDIALAGGRVVILDRENGARRFALRMKDIADARKLDGEQLAQIESQIAYYQRPQLRRGDGRELAAELWEADLVVFDSSRMFLSGMDLAEDKSDDYAQFMDELVDPLYESGAATLILDNAGWSDKGRPRGSSAKEDLNEHLFHGEKTEDFSRETTGEILLGVKESRDGMAGTWSMRIGGGIYEPWKHEAVRQVGRKQGKAERVARAEQLIKAKPSITNEELSAELGVDQKTVRRYRDEIAGRG